MSGKKFQKHLSQKDPNLEKIIEHQIILWGKPKIKEKYAWVCRGDFKDLERGLSILKISQDEFRVPWMIAEEIASLLVDVFSLSATSVAIKRAFAKAGGSNKNKKPVITKKSENIIFYKLSQPGENYLKSVLGRGLLRVLYLEPNSHNIANQELRDLVVKLKGKELKISDPYYGLNTLNILEEIVRAKKKVKFISYQSNESSLKFKRELSYLQKNYPKMIEMRIYPKNELHDRYIIANDSFVIIGHGIKDLGNKESLVLVIDDRFGKDVRKELEVAFWKRWQDQSCIIL